MIWLTEDPAPILVLGTLTAILLGAIWLQSGHRALLYSAIVVILLTAGGFLIERWIVTPREEIAETMQQIARDVESNDVSLMVKHLHSTLAALRERASQEMSSHDFHDVKIKRNLRMVVFDDETPARATAEFNVVVIVSDRSGMFQNRRVPRFMQVTFLREDGAWRVSDYHHSDPRDGLLKKRDAPHEQY
ncbi:MAG: hypothetical protein CMJ64_29495 [Planctomycetaceae bacterium]|nr:hypothetical protein [Planctomycetaceae bacterium]